MSQVIDLQHKRTTVDLLDKVSHVNAVLARTDAMGLTVRSIHISPETLPILAIDEPEPGTFDPDQVKRTGADMATTDVERFGRPLASLIWFQSHKQKEQA